MSKYLGIKDNSDPMDYRYKVSLMYLLEQLGIKSAESQDPLTRFFRYTARTLK